MQFDFFPDYCYLTSNIAKLLCKSVHDGMGSTKFDIITILVSHDIIVILKILQYATVYCDLLAQLQIMCPNEHLFF